MTEKEYEDVKYLLENYELSEEQRKQLHEMLLKKIEEIDEELKLRNNPQ